jgi:hypothetical protein
MKKTLYFNPNNDFTTITMHINTINEITIEIDDIDLTHNISLSYFDAKEFANDLLLLCDELNSKLNRRQIIQNIKEKYERA